jgi:hypothetical protein
MSASASPTAAVGDRPPLSSSFSSSASSTSSHCSRCSSTRPPTDPSPVAQAGSSTSPHRRFLTKADIAASLDAHDCLLAAAKEFRLACMAKAKASAALAGALDSCSRCEQPMAPPPPWARYCVAERTDEMSSHPSCCSSVRISRHPSPSGSRIKGADHSGPGLQAAAGFHYVLASTERVVADRLYKTFEIPLLETRDTYHAASNERSAAYAQALATRTKKIRETEEGHLRPPLSRAASGAKKGSAGGGGGGRDLGMLKETLRVLQEQIEELERVKGDYCDEVRDADLRCEARAGGPLTMAIPLQVLEAEQVLWSTVLSRTGTVLRAELSATATLGAKADDQVIAQVLSASPDPYLGDDDARKLKEAGSVLTSLPPLPLSSGPSTAATPAASGPSTPNAQSTPLPSESRTASLFGAADDQLDQEVEALLSPRLSRHDHDLALAEGSYFDESTPKRGQGRRSNGLLIDSSTGPAISDSSSSSSSSDSSDNDDDDDHDETISPRSHQPQRRKSLPFPTSASPTEAPVSVDPNAADAPAITDLEAEAPTAE